MCILKNGQDFIVTEKNGVWVVTYYIERVTVSCNISKNFCKTLGDVESYVMANEVF